jgi:hypothetical protein
LTNASEPAVVVVSATAASPAVAVDKPLGTQAFHLFDAMVYGPDAHKGHKMYVRGLLIKAQGEQRMTISTMEMLAPACSN